MKLYFICKIMIFALFQMITASGGLVGAIFGILAEGAGKFFIKINFSVPLQN